MNIIGTADGQISISSTRQISRPKTPPSPLKAYVVGTIDTKGEELHYVRDLIAEAGIPTVLVDVGPRSQEPDCDVRSAEVASFHPKSSSAVLVDDRGRAIDAMAQAFATFLPGRADIGGVIGLGGRAALRLSLQPYNSYQSAFQRSWFRLSLRVMCRPMSAFRYPNGKSGDRFRRTEQAIASGPGNAAHALVGMMRRPIELPEATKSAIGLTMYGVTTACVRHVTNSLKNQFDCLVFHATGPGGQSMERLIESAFLCGVIDTTTSDIVDLLMGGFFAAGNDRLEPSRDSSTRRGVLRRADMINFRGPETVPIHYRERRLHQHNPFITLVRTTPDENVIVGKWIGEKLNRCEGPVRFLIPEEGLSALDAPGQPFFDREADEALFNAIEATVRKSDSRIVRRLPFHINDPDFGFALVQSFLEVIEQGKHGYHEVRT